MYWKLEAHWCKVFLGERKSYKGEIRVEYISTHLMLADYFTKGLMGSKFREVREYIMGWRPISDLLVQLSDSRI